MCLWRAKKPLLMPWISFLLRQILLQSFTNFGHFLPSNDMFRHVFLSELLDVLLDVVDFLVSSLKHYSFGA